MLHISTYQDEHGNIKLEITEANPPTIDDLWAGFSDDYPEKAKKANAEINGATTIVEISAEMAMNGPTRAIRVWTKTHEVPTIEVSNEDQTVTLDGTEFNPYD